MPTEADEQAAYNAIIESNGADGNRYNEPLRPQYHYTPIKWWINDPNGLVYFNGEWHLFFQHHALIPGIAWGHAVGDDLVHWEHLCRAIVPDKLGHIWSGSAVVDWHDSSGFFAGKPGLVCIFTYYDPDDGGRQSQGMAYSADGRHFAKFEGNPIVPKLKDQAGQPDEADFRDPKVFWHEPTGRWIMVVAGGTVRFYSSPNLCEWTFESTNSDIQTECPDMFPLAVDGNSDSAKWVLSGAGDWYMLGSFDGHVFVPESSKVRLTYGPDCYASQTFSDTPDGRRIMVSWLYTWDYGEKLAVHPGGGMSIPIELKLIRTENGLRVVQSPVCELKTLREPGGYRAEGLAVRGDVDLPDAAGRELEIIAEFENVDATEFGIRVLDDGEGKSVVIGYRADSDSVFVDRSAWWPKEVSKQGVFSAVREKRSRTVKLHVFVDRSSVEAFADEGLISFSAVVAPDESADGVGAWAKEGTATLTSLHVFRLRSIWR